jgi:hypothetical protein
MITLIINKILIFGLFVSIFTIGKYIFDFVMELRKEFPEPIHLNKEDKLYLLIAVSYIFTFIFTGLL